MFDKIIVKNISSLFSIQMASYVIPLITVPYLVKTLGVSGYGYLGFAFAITQYAILLVNYGFSLSATSAVAKCKSNQQKVSQIFWNVTAIRLFAFFVSLIFTLLLANVVEQINEVLPIVLACFVSVLGLAIFPQWLFQGKEQLGLISFARIICQFSTLPFLFLCVEDSNDIWVAALISSSASLIVGIYSLWLVYTRGWLIWVKPTISSIKAQLLDGWHIFISTAAISLYTSSVTVILGFLSGPMSVGYFVAADKLIKAVLGIYGAISNAFYPRVNTVINESISEAKLLLTKLGVLLISVASIFSLLIYILAGILVSILFGAGHDQTVVILKIFSILPVIISLSNLCGIHILIPFGYKEDFSKILVFSGVSSLIVLLPLIDEWTEVGAAISVVLTELMVTVLMVYTVYKRKIMVDKNEV